MFDTALQNIMTGDPNTVGLILGFVGAIILTIFGLPPISLLNEGAVFEITLTTKMKINIWISRLGLLMLSAGFILQLVAAPLA